MKLKSMLLLLLFCGCASIQTEHKKLYDTWVIEENEDEYRGRYVYNFKENGTINIYDYLSKEDNTYRKSGKVGSFKILGDSITISWYNGKIPPIKYTIVKSEQGIILLNPDKKKTLHLIKKIQCNSTLLKTTTP